MKKVLVGMITLAASAGVGGALAAPATAATVHQYAHGTASRTSFPTWNACQNYAAWSAKNVVSHGGHLVSGDGARTKCFPVTNGRWTYLTVYTATKPLSSGDFSDSLADYRGDQVWFSEHIKDGSNNTFTAAQCAAELSATQRKIIGGSNVRLLPGAQCMTGRNSGERLLAVNYLSRTASSALSGDQVTRQDSSLLQEAWMLGYEAN